MYVQPSWRVTTAHTSTVMGRHIIATLWTWPHQRWKALETDNGFMSSLANVSVLTMGPLVDSANYIVEGSYNVRDKFYNVIVKGSQINFVKLTEKQNSCMPRATTALNNKSALRLPYESICCLMLPRVVWTHCDDCYQSIYGSSLCHWRKPGIGLSQTN